MNLQLLILPGRGRSGRPRKHTRKRLVSTVWRISIIFRSRKTKLEINVSLPQQPGNGLQGPGGRAPGPCPRPRRSSHTRDWPALGDPAPQSCCLTSGTPGSRPRPPRRREATSAAPWPAGKQKAPTRPAGSRQYAQADSAGTSWPRPDRPRPLPLASGLARPKTAVTARAPPTRRPNPREMQAVCKRSPALHGLLLAAIHKPCLDLSP